MNFILELCFAEKLISRMHILSNKLGTSINTGNIKKHREYQ